ncbi:prolyl aminopeptidase [Nocardia asteroides NBRC 15531]|uniref:Proline iminopeptidase n=1 Tax=Nocardia asteroides NBRC 15531 TaxID=1110697 RepID=U5EFT1_NOCAS|nr:prolyl aminopeptidase [Nocardia asteroides]TLF69933.1 prolyl aminopeptidase [Nocardia asteroides NBRC 15531]UGT49444.1 prolyl aminopeptidase [Nocardia asteroides]SFL90721.1 prolyl aminopeptidase Serine peptidase. MEROPS family S33 [Nocardia asteroides]VEG38018.1 Proline iminopeptidase [Nocardia asteroides]GAD84044.1 putative prolyl aminopeptidase [Nocardia asteroides NBRC 15531]
MSAFFPPIDPYADGLLEVGDGNEVYWCASGNPAGRPVLVVHGGPGSGSSERARKSFDPSLFRIVQCDQRGCGRSIPNAADPATDMTVNTTEHLIADMERLRVHLGIDRWLLYGGSWGSTLILAYAQRYPERVTGIILIGVTTTRRREIDWLYQGLARLLPAEWSRFRSVLGRDSDLVEGYRQLLEHPDPAVRRGAAIEWCRWEDAVIAHESQGSPGQYSAVSDADMLAFVRICTHYFAHGAWLDEGVLLRDAGRLAGIPGELIHGRLDLSAPLETAWELANAWPDARLHVIDDSGHTGSPAMGEALAAALARFAQPDTDSTG